MVAYVPVVSGSIVGELPPAVAALKSVANLAFKNLISFSDALTPAAPDAVSGG